MLAVVCKEEERQLTASQLPPVDKKQSHNTGFWELEAETPREGDPLSCTCVSLEKQC